MALDNDYCLPYNPFFQLLRTSTRKVLGLMRRGYLKTVLPRKNAGMDRTDSHVTTDGQVYAVLFENEIKKLK